jgi:hypothetical protein
VDRTDAGIRWNSNVNTANGLDGDLRQQINVHGAGWEIYVQADEQPSWWVSSNLDLTVKDALKDTGQISCAWTTDFEAKQCSLSISSGARMGNYKILNLVKRTSNN